MVLKGYRRDHLYDAWSRYLPPDDAETLDSSPIGATSATSVTPLVSGLREVAGSGSDPLPATRDMALTRAVAEVAQVGPGREGDDMSGHFGFCPDCGKHGDTRPTAKMWASS